MSNDAIHNFLDCSTGHLVKEDVNKLDALKDSDIHPCRVTNHLYGWYVWMPGNDAFEEAVEEWQNQYGFSSAFGNVLRYAQSKDCWLINFDRDAEQVDELEYFEW
jgi:hypothetical protein